MASKVKTRPDKPKKALLKGTNSQIRHKTHHEHVCDGLGGHIGEFVLAKVEARNGGVFLQEIDRKDTVSGCC